MRHDPSYVGMRISSSTDISRRGAPMEINSRDWIYVTGKAYSGKTTWIKQHIAVIPKTHPVFILDFNCNDYQEYAKRKDNEVMIWNVKTGNLQEIEKALHIPYEAGNCTVVCSESDNYIRNETPFLRQFVTTGRNRGINALVDGKRPKSVPPDYRSRFNKLVLFQTSLPEDQEYLEDWAGQPKGSFAMLSTLQNGQHIIVDTDNQTVSDVKKLNLGGGKSGRNDPL